MNSGGKFRKTNHQKRLSILIPVDVVTGKMAALLPSYLFVLRREGVHNVYCLAYNFHSFECYFTLHR